MKMKKMFLNFPFFCTYTFCEIKFTTYNNSIIFLVIFLPKKNFKTQKMAKNSGLIKPYKSSMFGLACSKFGFKI